MVLVKYLGVTAGYLIIVHWTSIVHGPLQVIFDQVSGQRETKKKCTHPTRFLTSLPPGYFFITIGFSDVAESDFSTGEALDTGDDARHTIATDKAKTYKDD